MSTIPDIPPKLDRTGWLALTNYLKRSTTATAIISKDGSTYYAHKYEGTLLSSSTTFSTVFQAAVDAVRTLGGGTVFIRPGLYEVTAALSMLDSSYTKISILGAGDSTILKKTALTNIFQVQDGASFIEIGNFQVDGNKSVISTSSHYTFRMRNDINNIYLHDLYIHDNIGYGVIFDSINTGEIPTDIRVERMRLIDNNYPALSLACTNITATDIRVRTPPEATETSPVTLEIDFSHYVVNNVVLDRFWIDGGKRGLLFTDVTGDTASKNRIRISNGIISNSIHHGLDLYAGTYQNVRIDNVTLRSNFIGLYTRIPGVRYRGLVFDGNTTDIDDAGCNVLGKGTDTIASGTTSKTVTHLLGYTPVAADIDIRWTENPTNDPGNWWITSAGATTFVVNVRNNPGASNLDFGWSVRQV